MDKFDEFYMKVAHDVANLSYARKRKVGSVLVKDKNILAFGYNGTISGSDNTCEDLIDGKWITRETVLHSEENVLAKMAKATQSCEHASIYITYAPCLKCSRLLFMAGVDEFVYRDVHPKKREGIELLLDYGKIVRQI